MDSLCSPTEVLSNIGDLEAEYLIDYEPHFELPDGWDLQRVGDPLNSNDSANRSEIHLTVASKDVPNVANDLDQSDVHEFACTLLVYTRQFKGQSSGSFVARWQISANNTKCFIHKVWELSKVHLIREVVFNQKADGTTSPMWGMNEVPAEEEFDRFVLFQSGRRHYSLDRLKESSSLLQSWKGKDISLLLHVYSLSISNRAVWNSVKEKLIDPSERDRLGAATT